MTAYRVEADDVVPGPEAGGGGQSPPLRILFVSARFAPFVGGTEIHTGEVAAELVRRGHHVTVVTTDLSGALPKWETIDGVRVVRVRAWPSWIDLHFAPGIAAIIDDGDWDLVHVQGYHTAVAPLALAAAQRRGIPTALTFHSGGHSSRLRNGLRPLHTKFLSRWLRRTDMLIGVSAFEANLFARRLGLPADRIEVMPNGVPAVDTVQPHPPGGDADRPRGPHILSVGRLVRYKGHHRVIRALPHIRAVHPEATLTILGDGPYRRSLQRLARRLGLTDAVTFDFVPGDERPRLLSIMADASVAMFLSSYESHGMAAHEALSTGLPAVVLDGSALGDLAAEGLADAVPLMATDREVASIVLRTLDAQRSDRPQGASPDLQRLQHSWPVIVGRLEAAYRQVLTERAARASRLRSDIAS
ncbi:MAG: glycosyltransferase family 4 protein [Actinomycetota bacterium]